MKTYDPKPSSSSPYNNLTTPPLLFLSGLLLLLGLDSYNIHIVFTPIYILGFISFFQKISSINRSNTWEDLVNQFMQQSQNCSDSRLRILLGCLFHTTLPLLCVYSFLQLGQQIQSAKLQQNYKLTFMEVKYFIFIALICWILSSILLKKCQNIISNNMLLFSSGIGSPISNIILSWTVICQGGVCYTLYISTFTSILGAFGITVIDINEILQPLQIVLLIIFLVSMYKAAGQNKCRYAPLWVGTVGSLMILCGIYNVFGSGGGVLFKKVCLHSGNGLVIGASLWNMKRQKFFGV